MAKIGPDEIEKVALLSRLTFGPAQAERYAAQLSQILDYADQLSELDTDAIEPTSHSLPLTNVMREDVVAESLSPELALANAPEAEAQCFRVPKIIHQGS